MKKIIDVTLARALTTTRCFFDTDSGIWVIVDLAILFALGLTVAFGRLGITTCSESLLSLPCFVWSILTVISATMFTVCTIIAVWAYNTVMALHDIEQPEKEI